MARFSQYFNMVHIYIAALILTFCQVSNAELTSSDETQVDEIEMSEPSTDVYSENTCTRIETQFQNYVMNIMDSAISASSKSYHCLMGGIRNNGSDCKKLNSMNLGNLKKYRRSLKRVYQEMANDWVREESKQDPRFKACLGLPVQFERNIRRVKLKVKPDIPGHSCQPIITRWSHGLDQLTQEYLDGKRTITSLDPEEIASLKAFHHSPLKRIISTNALFDSRLNNSELKQKLASAYNTIRIGVEKLKKKVSKLKDRQKYILFDFQNQFTAFTNTLPPQTRPKATRCIKSSGFFRDCTINVSKQGSRCGSRIWRLGKEMLPVIPLIDSIKGMGNVMAAEASGVMTSSEATQKRAELATLGILGLGGIAGGVSLLARPLVRSTVRAGRPKTARRRDSSRVLLQSVRSSSSIPRGQLISSPFHQMIQLKRMGVDLKKQLVSSHIKATTHLEKMGVNYSPVLDSNSKAFSLARLNNNIVARNAENVDPSDLFNLSDIPVEVQGVLRIRKGATRRKRHTNPRGLALEHKDIDVKIKEAEEMGVKVVVDTSLDRTLTRGYYSPKEKILAIRSDSDWLTFEHEFQHALFDKYLRGHALRDSPLSSARLISRSGQSLRQMREQLPDQIRRHWSEREQNVILRYMRDDLPEQVLNERLSVNRELELLGWRRYTPFNQQRSNYATRHLINELNHAGSLTARQRPIRNQAYITHYTQTHGVNAAMAVGGGGIGLGIAKDLNQQEDSFLLNLPKNIRSAIQSAKEVFYSERGILVRNQNGQTQFFPSEKRK